MITARSSPGRLVRAVAAGLVVFSCGGEETPGSGAGGAGGSAGGDAAPNAPACDRTACTAPIGAKSANVETCCMGDGSCGLTSPTVGDTCLAPSQPGRADEACAPFEDPKAGRLDGCCGPSGCGALNPWIGCIANADLGLGEVSCAYDPTNDCTTLTAVGCDPINWTIQSMWWDPQS